MELTKFRVEMIEILQVIMNFVLKFPLSIQRTRKKERHAWLPHTKYFGPYRIVFREDKNNGIYEIGKTIGMNIYVL